MSLPSYKYIKKLNGKRVLIRGGTSGIGFAVAEACFEYGANIIISGSNSERLEKTVQRLRDCYGTVESRVHTYICDLSDEDNLESNVEKLLQAATENGTQKLNHIAFTAGDSIPIQNVNDVTIPIIRKQEIVRMIAKHLDAYIGKAACQQLHHHRWHNVIGYAC